MIDFSEFTENKEPKSSKWSDKFEPPTPEFPKLPLSVLPLNEAMVRPPSLDELQNTGQNARTAIAQAPPIPQPFTRWKAGQIDTHDDKIRRWLNYYEKGKKDNSVLQGLLDSVANTGNLFNILGGNLSKKGYLKALKLEPDVGEWAAAKEAYDIYKNNLKWNDPEKYTGILEDIPKVATEFGIVNAAFPGAGTMQRFAAQRALQQEDETWKEKAVGTIGAAAMGKGLDIVGNVVPKGALGKVLKAGIATTGLGALTPGGVQDKVNTMITILGFEGVGAIQGALNGKPLAKVPDAMERARQLNPKLRDISDSELESYLFVFDAARDKSIPVQPTLKSEGNVRIRPEDLGGRSVSTMPEAPIGRIQEKQTQDLRDALNIPQALAKVERPITTLARPRALLTPPAPQEVDYKKPAPLPYYRIREKIEQQPITPTETAEGARPIKAGVSPKYALNQIYELMNRYPMGSPEAEYFAKLIQTGQFKDNPNFPNPPSGGQPAILPLQPPKPPSQTPLTEPESLQIPKPIQTTPQTIEGQVKVEKPLLQAPKAKPLTPTEIYSLKQMGLSSKDIQKSTPDELRGQIRNKPKGKGGMRKGSLMIPTKEELAELKKNADKLLQPETPTQGVAIKQLSNVEKEPVFQNTVNTILGSMGEIKKLSKTEVEDARHKLRSQQIAKGIAFTEQGIKENKPAGQIIRSSKKGYAGQMESPTFTPPKITDEGKDSISRRILEVYPIGSPNPVSQFYRTNTQDAFDKVFAGVVPQPAEFGYIEKIIGKKAAIALWDSIRPYQPYGLIELLKDANAITKMIFGWDLQYPRQTSTIQQRNPVIFAKGVKTAVKSLVSEKFSDQMEAELRANPNHEIAQKAGVNFLSDRPWAIWQENAEQHPSDLPERMAKLGQKSIKPLKYLTTPIRAIGTYFTAQNRSMATSMNQTMQALFDEQYKSLQTKHLSGEELNKQLSNNADAINTLVKILRAKNPTLRAFQKAANFFFFSPSMTAARPYQAKVLVANKGARGYTASAIASDIAKIYLISMMAKLAGNWWRSQNPDSDKKPPIDGELNITSSKWGKVLSDRTEFDISGGNVPFYRTLIRLAVQHYKTQSGEETEAPFWNTVSQYFKSRESGLVSLGEEQITGKDWLGKPISRGMSLWNHLSPSFVNDFYDAFKYSGLPQAIISQPADFLSTGTQTYPEGIRTQRKIQMNQLAQKSYGKNWNDLNLNQRKDLSKKNPQLEQMQAEARVKEPMSSQSAIDQTKESAKRLSDSIDPKIKKFMTDNNYALTGVSKSVGNKGVLSDIWYDRYEEIVSEAINKRLQAALIKPKEPENVTRRKLDNTIRDIKEKARKQLYTEMGKE